MQMQYVPQPFNFEILERCVPTGIKRTVPWLYFASRPSFGRGIGG